VTLDRYVASLLAMTFPSKLGVLRQAAEARKKGRRTMLRLAWNAYRGWAKRARELQAAAGRWNLLALLCVVLAAACGAATALVPPAPSPGSGLGFWLASAATVAAAVGAYLGREIVGSGKEAGWIQARATAEGLKSECFRYAAKAGQYAGAEAEAAKAFKQRIDDLAKGAVEKSLVPADDTVPASGDKREPVVPLTKDWYTANRIEEQIEYYRKGRAGNEVLARRLWWVAFASGLAAVAFGALGAWVEVFAPWIGAMTTIAASIAAFGLIDRRKYLISSYAAMQASLEGIKALDQANPASLTDLVTATEDLLDSEHKAWQPQMLAMQHKPQAATEPAKQDG
jgi:SMODS and SLOG-associating 2TM effector domain 1/SMODS and SLOG-associating 2TM effector domain 3